MTTRATSNPSAILQISGHKWENLLCRVPNFLVTNCVCCSSRDYAGGWRMEGPREAVTAGGTVLSGDDSWCVAPARSLGGRGGGGCHRCLVAKAGTCVQQRFTMKPLEWDFVLPPYSQACAQVMSARTQGGEGMKGSGAPGGCRWTCRPCLGR